MRNHRKKYLVDYAVQGALVRRMILHWLIFFAVSALLLPFWRVLSRGDLLRPFSSMMLDGWAETAPVLVILLALFPAFIWDTVKLSNRFAGPVYRFHKTLQKLAAGEDVQPLRLRQGDFWKDVADDFNRVLQRLDQERKQNGISDDCSVEQESCSAG